MSTIIRYRGDTAPDRFAIISDGVAANITGSTFELTVDSLKDPLNTATQLYSLVGTITNGAAGYLEFAPNSTQANQTPGRYYYDVQMTDGTGAIRTVVKGAYKYAQDITKV